MVLTIGTAAVLCSVMALYSVLMRPVVPTVPPQPPPKLAVLDEDDSGSPVENVRVAETYLAAQQPWTTSARIQLYSPEQGAFLFTNDWQPEGKEGRIRLSPFAMAWVTINKDSGLEEAVTVVSESASLKFSGKFDMMSSEAGRVIGATLEGRTQITGPNGLVFDGRNFHFSEASAKLWSDLPVTFTYAGNKGSANRFQADLIPQAGPPERDRPHIFGVRTVRLSQNVKMDLQLKQKEEPLTLKMKCAGNFEYEIPRQTATFTENVVAFRQPVVGVQEFDWIECDKLTVLFGDPKAEPIATEPPIPTAGASPQYQRMNQTLKFRRLQAERFTPTAEVKGGKTVQTFQLQSMQNKLRASFRQLVYDAEQQVLALTDPDGVKVLQAQTQLQSPEVMLQFGAENKLIGALCRGSGWVNYKDPITNTILFAADWKQHLRHLSDAETGLDMIELADTASFRQPNENSALGAELIRVWTTPIATAGPLNLDGKKTEKTDAAEKPKKPNIQLRRMEASQDVVLISPQLEGRCQHLEAAVDLQAPPRTVRPGSSPVGLQRKPKDNQEARLDEFPLVAGADRIRVRLVPTTTAQPDVAEVWTDGHVTLTQQHAGGKLPLSIKGEHVHLQHHGGEDQVAEITGSPAEVRENGLYLEAGYVLLERADNRLGVKGKGLLQLPVKNDFNGKPLAEEQTLDVTWKERMTFDGRQADFHGQARAKTGDREIKCDRMEVVLNEKLSFVDAASRSSGKPEQRVDLAAVHCYNDVTFQDYTRDGAKLIGVQRAEVWEMHINRVTGEMTAQGPGRMQMWQRSQGNRGQITPTQSARANAPTKVDATDWEYTFVKFDGKMDGNMLRRYSTFKDRCEILHGPVKHPHDTIHRDQLPRNGGMLRCQELQVMQAAGTDEDRGKIQLVGKGDADLEGQGFYAKADQISYDESKKSYTLHGVGKSLAQLWHQDTPGTEARLTTLQRIEFIPETNVVRAIGITGADGGR